MDIALVLRQRLREMGLGQRELAANAGVTEGYISQLLNGKKAPPAPRRTDIYPRIEAFLKLPDDFLTNLAELELTARLKLKLMDQPAPLFAATRALILSKCKADKAQRVRTIFEKDPFGDLERLVTKKLLDVTKGVVKEEQDREGWIQEFSRLSGRTTDQTRIDVRDFLDTDIFHLSTANRLSFLEPLVEFWDIDLENFAIKVLLNERVVAEPEKTLEFVETNPGQRFEVEPGLTDFLADSRLSGGVTELEIQFLKKLRFKTMRPTALYYYRELQSLRDPLHFDKR